MRALQIWACLIILFIECADNNVWVSKAICSGIMAWRSTGYNIYSRFNFWHCLLIWNVTRVFAACNCIRYSSIHAAVISICRIIWTCSHLQRSCYIQSCNSCTYTSMWATATSVIILLFQSEREALVTLTKLLHLPLIATRAPNTDYTCQLCQVATPLISFHYRAVHCKGLLEVSNFNILTSRTRIHT